MTFAFGFSCGRLRLYITSAPLEVDCPGSTYYQLLVTGITIGAFIPLDMVQCNFEFSLTSAGGALSWAKASEIP